MSMEQFHCIIGKQRMAHNDTLQKIRKAEEELATLRSRLADRNRFGPFYPNAYATCLRLPMDRFKEGGRIVATDAMDAMNISEALQKAAEEAAYAANAHRDNELLPIRIQDLERDIERWTAEAEAEANLITLLTESAS